MKNITFIILSIFISFNCTNTIVYYKKPSDDPKAKIKQNRNVRYQTIGLGMYELKKPVTPNSDCKNGVNHIHIQRDWLDMTTHILIGVFYTSRSIKLYCRK